MIIDDAEYYSRILRHSPLETDARCELSRIVALLKQDSKLALYNFAAHLYPFLTHTLSAPQTLFICHLDEFKGGLLRSAYANATGSPHCAHDDCTIDYEIERIQRVASAVGKPMINAAQLAFALTIFNITEVRGPIKQYRLDDKELSRVVRFEYEQGNEFWGEHGISLETMVKLSRSLLDYDGTDILTPEDIANRFTLSLSIEPQGITVRPLERWGTHFVSECNESLTHASELWFPTDTIVTQDQLSAFEDLLAASTASEADWQHFF